jgi:type II secretory pathway pseudopilin PulG
MIGFAEMTKSECRMTKECQMMNVERNASTGVRHSRFVISSSFNARPAPTIRASSFRAEGAVTIIELLVVIMIILILAGLILSISSYVQNKGARARAETEIAAMSAALESYKADNGIYPRDPCSTTDNLRANSSGNPANYQTASLYLYKQLSGDTNANFQPPAGARSYFTFKPQMLDGPRNSNGNLTGVTYIKDPFRNSYGYSTAYTNYLDEVAGNPPCYGAPNPGATVRGYNPTFDVWSTSGLKTNPPTAADQNQWIKNW